MQVPGGFDRAVSIKSEISEKLSNYYKEGGKF